MWSMPIFQNLNQLTNGMNLVTNDRILSHSPARLETIIKMGQPSKVVGQEELLPMRRTYQY
jgi:hypothetical protein